MSTRLRCIPPLLTALAALLLTIATPRATRADLAPTTPTFALKWGNPGTAAGQFNAPFGVAVDALGNVYVVDAANNRIQKFDFLGNFITQWGSPGIGNGQFSSPFSVLAHRSGNVYVSDFFNCRVQKFTSDGTYVTEWGSFGTDNGQFDGPQGLATDAAGNIYVSDYGNDRVQKFTSNGVYLSQWGTFGAGNGQLSGPTGITLDAAGNIYVTEWINHRVQKFSSSGAYLAQWGSLGSGDGQFDQPAGITVDAAGNLYVSDVGNHRVQKFNSTGAYLTQWGSLGTANGQFNLPFGVAADAAGNLYVTEWDGDRVQKFSGAGVAVTQAMPVHLLSWGSVGNGNGQFNWPQGIAVDASGNVFVTELNNSRVQKFTSTGAYLTQWGSFGAGNGQFREPYGVATDAAGDVYVVELQGLRVQKFNNTGGYTTQWGSLGSGNGNVRFPQDIAVDPAGNVLIADTHNHRIQKFTNTGGYLAQWGSSGSGNGQFSFPTSLDVDPAGFVYVSEQDNPRIQKFTGAGAYVTQWPLAFTGRGGLAASAAGEIYVTDGTFALCRASKFTSAGTALGDWGSPGSGPGQFNSPQGVATDAAGNVYIADRLNQRVQKFSTPPLITLVSDVANDQGRQVQLRVLRTSADSPGSGLTITDYEVYRRNDALSLPALAASGTQAAALGKRVDSADPAAIALAGWTYVGSFPAHGESEYTVVVPTLANATSASVYYSAFMVRAATADPFKFIDSGAEYGYSVDNLSPPAPNPFTAAFAAGATHLDWALSPAPDFATFRLYRGASANFVPDAGTLIATTTNFHYVDPGPAGRYYKLAAVDLNGNEGPHALVGPQQTTDVPAGASFSFALGRVRPNPAHGRDVTVDFALPTQGRVVLDLLDVAGRKVAAREWDQLGPGSHTVLLTQGVRMKPGLYFVRLTQGTNQRVARLTVLD